MIKDEVDEDYIRILEKKLCDLRAKPATLTAKQVLTDLAKSREDKLFNLLTSTDSQFEAQFQNSQPIVTSFLKRKIAPQTVAVQVDELYNLPKFEHQPLHNKSDVICVRVSGQVFWMNGTHSADLRLLFNKSSQLDETLEIVASDCALDKRSNDLAFLATCWVALDEQLIPLRYYAALFKVDSKLNLSLSYKVELESVPSYTRVTAESVIANNRHCWLIFTSNRAARLFVIEPNSLRVEEIESIGDIYPGLDLGDLPGSAIRSNCLQTALYRWSVLGFDTGYVIATTLSLKTNFIEDRCKLKFSGAISVLQIFTHSGREDRVSILISSTLGPAAIWCLAMSADKTHFQWKRVTVLEETKGRDAIVCSAVTQHFLAIGTYGGSILIYKRESLLMGESYVESYARVELCLPIISMIFLSDSSLVALSTSGLHSFTTSKSDSESEICESTGVHVF